MAERPNATVCKTVKPQVQILLGAPDNWKVKSIGDENCLENSRAVKRLEGSTPLPSANFYKESIMDTTEYWKWIHDNVQ